MITAVPRLKQKIITTDPYDFFHETVQWFVNPSIKAFMSRHEKRVSIAAALTRSHNKRLWIMPQAFEGAWPGDYYYDSKSDKIVLVPGSILSFRMCSTAELRWQIWHGLLHGVKGFVPFVLLDKPKLAKEAFIKKHGENYKIVHDNPRGLKKSLPLDPVYALITQGLQVSPQLDEIGNCYALIARHSQTLATLERSTPILFAGGNGASSTFADPDGNKFAVVLNNDLSKPTEIILRTLPCVSSIKNLDTGKLLPQMKDDARTDNLKAFKIELPPGGGAFLKISPTTHTPLLAKLTFAPNAKPGVKIQNLKLTRIQDDFRYEFIVDESAEAFLEFDMKHWARRKFAPKVYKNSSVFLKIEGKGFPACEFLNEAAGTIKTVEWKGFPLQLPDNTASIRIRLKTREASVREFSLLKCEVGK
jgi:hypothetical protein